jgi:hypothetical protein
LHGFVANGPDVILALHGDTPALGVQDDVDALIPNSPTHQDPMPHRPEEVGHEEFELGSAHKTDVLEAPGELLGYRGPWPAA